MQVDSRGRHRDAIRQVDGAPIKAGRMTDGGAAFNANRLAQLAAPGRRIPICRLSHVLVKKARAADAIRRQENELRYAGLLGLRLSN